MQRPLSGDPARLRAGQSVNRNKLATVLDLSTPEGKEVFRRLVAVCDLVIENFSPRVMRNFGFEYEALRQIKPDIIMVSMPAFGSSGPLRDFTSFGPGIDAMSGLSHLSGYPDSTPLKPGNYYCDYNAGLGAAMAAMAALYHRRKTGKGQHVELPMRDGETQLIGEYVLDYTINGRVQKRMANYSPTMAPHNVYRCAGDDKWLAITVKTDEEWSSLCRAIGRPELATDARFATIPDRKRNETALDAEIAAWSQDKEHIAAMELLQSAGVPAAAVMTPKEIAEDPQYQLRGSVQEVSITEDDSVRLQRPAWLANHANTELSPAPLYSEHTREVFQGLLGMSEQEVNQLAEKKVTWIQDLSPTSRE